MKKYLQLHFASQAKIAKHFQLNTKKNNFQNDQYVFFSSYTTLICLDFLNYFDCFVNKVNLGGDQRERAREKNKKKQEGKGKEAPDDGLSVAQRKAR